MYYTCEQRGHQPNEHHSKHTLQKMKNKEKRRLLKLDTSKIPKNAKNNVQCALVRETTN